jgi:hypothetical protein
VPILRLPIVKDAVTRTVPADLSYLFFSRDIYMHCIAIRAALRYGMAACVARPLTDCVTFSR